MLLKLSSDGHCRNSGAKEFQHMAPLYKKDRFIDSVFGRGIFKLKEPDRVLYERSRNVNFSVRYI